MLNAKEGQPRSQPRLPPFYIIIVGKDSYFFTDAQHNTHFLTNLRDCGFFRTISKSAK